MVHRLQLLQRNFAETSDGSVTVDDGLSKAVEVISTFREFSKPGSVAGRLAAVI